jgi:hypothetical protein
LLVLLLRYLSLRVYCQTGPKWSTLTAPQALLVATETSY